MPPLLGGGLLSVSLLSRPLAGRVVFSALPLMREAAGGLWDNSWVDKILYRWSVVKYLPTKPGVASVRREAVGVVRASVR